MSLNFSLPSRPDLEQLRNQAKTLLKMHQRADAECLPVLRRLRQFTDKSDAEILASDLALSEVQFALAMYYDFANWDALRRHAVTQSSPRLLQLEMSAGQACIRGLEELDWGGTFYQRQESLMTALTSIFQAAGHEVDFDEIMGLSGAAFKLVITRPWCPSVGSSGVGADCPDHIMKVLGCPPLESLDPPIKSNATRQAIMESIDRGLPAIYMDGEFSLIVGYRKAGKTWICQPYPGGHSYKEMDVLKGMLGGARWVNIIHPDEPMPRRQAVVESLQRIVEMAEASAEENTFRGFCAYQAWIEDLQAPPKNPNLHANAYAYAILLTSPTAGAVYLDRTANELGEEMAKPLRAAARRYRAVSSRLLAERDCVAHPWDRSWTPDSRAKQAKALGACLKDERQAVKDVKSALASLQ